MIRLLYWVRLGLFRSSKEEDIIRFKVLTQGEETTRIVNKFSANVGIKISLVCNKYFHIRKAEILRL